MREIRQQGVCQYIFSRYDEPVAQVKSGETLAIYTDDAFESQITRESDRPSEILGPYPSPQTGLIFIEGAEPGTPSRRQDRGHRADPRLSGQRVRSLLRWPDRNQAHRTPDEPLPDKVWLYRLKDGWLEQNEWLRFRWRPFMRTAGTAPELEASPR